MLARTHWSLDLAGMQGSIGRMNNYTVISCNSNYQKLTGAVMDLPAIYQGITLFYEISGLDLCNFSFDME